LPLLLLLLACCCCVVALPECCDQILKAFLLYLAALQICQGFLAVDLLLLEMQ
jgi:hypothetical protein